MLTCPSSLVGQIVDTLTLGAPRGDRVDSGYVGTVEVAISADGGLEAYCRGGRVLKVCMCVRACVCVCVTEFVCAHVCGRTT